MIITIDKDGVVNIYIDRAHTIHSDGKSYLEIFITMGYSIIINISKKLGVVTINSTKIEVVSNGERFSKCT